MPSKWNNYSSFIAIDRRLTAVIIPFENTPQIGFIFRNQNAPRVPSQN